MILKEASKKTERRYLLMVWLWLCLLIILSFCVGCSLRENSADSSDDGSRSNALISDVATAENSEREEDTEKDDIPRVTDTPTPQPTATLEPVVTVTQSPASSSAPLPTEPVYAGFDYDDVPEYSDRPYVKINGDIPFFSADMLTTECFEDYGELDELGRCTECIACVGEECMPAEERGPIGQIKPTGWHTVKYKGIDGNYLYNRCHLIGYQLTAENANPRNLITGTRYLNVQGMSYWEDITGNYILSTGNHVLYRSTPIFVGEELLVRGVLLEAVSVEDNGAGLCFCVFCYNVQPDVIIDYSTGESWGEEYTGSTPTPTDEPQITQEPDISATPDDKGEVTYIFNTRSMKFHYPDCSGVAKMAEHNKYEFYGTREEAIAAGYSPCGICKP